MVNVTKKIKLFHEVDLVFDHSEHTKKLLVTKRESPEVSLYAFKPVCRTTFETPLGKLRNLLGMKLTTDVTLLFRSAVDNGIFDNGIFYVTSVDYEIN